MLLDRDLFQLYQLKNHCASSASSPQPLTDFLPDFLFELSDEEVACLLSQDVIPSRRTLRGANPLALTGQGIAMLLSVLTSRRAIEVNIVIMRTFVRLRQLLTTYEELAHWLEELEWRQAEQDGKVQFVFETIQHLIEAPTVEHSPPSPNRKFLAAYTSQRSHAW